MDKGICHVDGDVTSTHGFTGNEARTVAAPARSRPPHGRGPRTVAAPARSRPPRCTPRRRRAAAVDGRRRRRAGKERLC
jgi:hypothetical protein